MRPVSIDAELARRDAPILHRGQPISGYFDGHGRYHPARGTIRRGKDGALELRRQVGFMRTETTRFPLDSVRTVITDRKRTSPYPTLALMSLGLVFLIP